mgnify:FL=1
MPSIFMRRWASRLTLTVTDIRRQPLQDISHEDALSEGVERFRIDMSTPFPPSIMSDCSYRLGFWNMWNSLHTKAGERWDDNPDVIAVTFTVERWNIDA